MTDSVTQPTPWHNPPEMSAFGIIIAASIALVLLPVLPFLAIIYAVGRMRQSDALEKALSQ